MPAPRVCVLRAPGTNCDPETAFAFENCGGRPERVHLFRLLEQPTLLDEFQVLCVPGGFSYGDDIGAGVIFGSELRTRLGDAVQRFLQADKLALGICNGFQTLLKAGVLPGGAAGWSTGGREQATATLTWNNNGKYTARWVRLRVAAANNVFLRGMTEIDVPIAHAEGRLVVSDPALIEQWRSSGQVALQYIPWAGTDGASHPVNERWAANPNGAVGDIAGLGDPSGRVLGLMPHPERFLFATQHPHWTRLGMKGEGAGMQVFRNAVEYFR